MSGLQQGGHPDDERQLISKVWRGLLLVVFLAILSAVTSGVIFGMSTIAT